MFRVLGRLALIFVFLPGAVMNLSGQRLLPPDGLPWFTLPIEDTNETGPDITDSSFVDLTLLERFSVSTLSPGTEGGLLGAAANTESYRYLTRFANVPDAGRHILYFDMPDENGVFQRMYRDFQFRFMGVQDIFFFQTAVVGTLADDGGLRQLNLRQLVNSGNFGDTSGSLAFLDENADQIVDSIRISYENRERPTTTVLFDVVVVDLNEDDKPDAISLPHTPSLMAAFEIRPQHFGTLGQIWLPLNEGRVRIDGDEDGVEDTRFARSSAFGDPLEITRFAQFGDGNQAPAPAAEQPGLSTELYLLNTGAPNGGAGLDAEVTVKLTGNDGNPLPGIDLNGEMLDQGMLSSMIPAGAMRIFRTDGIGPLTAGSVAVESTNVLTGVLNFAGPFGSAGVGTSVPLSNFGFPVIADLTGSTGIAMANPANLAVAGTVRLFDADGNLLATAPFQLAARGHLSIFINDLEWTEEPDVTLDFSDFLGVAKVTVDDGLVIATAIRTRPAQFLSLPVTSATLAAGSTTLYLSQFGNGQESGITLTSDVVLINLGETEAMAGVTFRGDSGNGIEGLEINGQPLETGSIDVLVPACGVRVLRSSGSGPLVAGAVTVETGSPLGAVILFDGVGAAGVGAGSPLPNFTLPVIVSGLANTGLAVQNPNQSGVTVNLVLTDLDGSELATTAIQLPGRGHISLFVADLQWDPPVDFTQFEGMVKGVVGSQKRVVLTVIQLRPNEFLTMPVGPNPQ